MPLISSLMPVPRFMEHGINLGQMLVLTNSLVVLRALCIRPCHVTNQLMVMIVIAQQLIWLFKAQLTVDCFPIDHD